MNTIEFPYGVEITLKKTEDFSVVRETLERIGVANRKEKILNPSCYLLHKKGKYYIMHFKEMLELDGKETNISEHDYFRRNAIARLLQEWGLCTIVDTKLVETEPTFVYVLPHKDRPDWAIEHKYTIGVPKKPRQ
jgi:hypothetical protein